MGTINCINNQDTFIDISNDKSESIAQLLKDSIVISTEKSNGPTPEKKRPKSDTNRIIKNVNNKFLIDILSPEIRENEIKKREHKDALMTAMKIFLSIQFIIVFLVVGYTLWSIISCHKNNNPFDNSTIQLLFGFVGAYITSVVVELIAILKYIVTNVFDTSIASLVEVFKEKPQKE